MDLFDLSLVGLSLAGCCWLALTAPPLDDEDEEDDRDPGEAE